MASIRFSLWCHSQLCAPKKGFVEMRVVMEFGKVCQTDQNAFQNIIFIKGSSILEKKLYCLEKSKWTMPVKMEICI